ncbi:MAG: helix-turn-helix domain-containing protein, partial [Pseudonocardiaceae bacterium]
WSRSAGEERAVVATSSPTVLRRWIALELRKLRESTGTSRQQTAQRLRCAVSTVTHFEIARNLPKAAELEILLDFYGVAERTESFLELLTAARKGKDWWLPFAGTAPPWFDLFLGLETSAAQIESYEALTITGLFQTEAYAEAVIRTGNPELSDHDVAQRIELRMARQDVLARQPNPPTVWSVLDESVLHRLAARPRVMREQLEHLAKLADLPTINIQVLPMAAGISAGMNGTFTLLSFPPELVGDPGVVYTESLIKGTYYEDPTEIMCYRNTLTRLQIQAATPEQSHTIITRRAEEMT